MVDVVPEETIHEQEFGHLDYIRTLANGQAEVYTSTRPCNKTSHILNDNTAAVYTTS